MENHKYVELTRSIKDKNGNEQIVCRFYDTKKCQLHNHDCKNCAIMRAILTQLNAFECVYKEAKD